MRLAAESSGNVSNYTCTVRIWYWDGAGSWNIGASVNGSSTTVVNTTATLTINELKSFVINTGNGANALAFSLNAGAANTTSTNDPLTLNNTGNAVITNGNVTINATDLVGETIVR